MPTGDRSSACPSPGAVPCPRIQARSRSVTPHAGEGTKRVLKGCRTQSARWRVSSQPAHRGQGRGGRQMGGTGSKTRCHPAPLEVDGEVTVSIASAVPVPVRQRMQVCQLSCHGGGGIAGTKGGWKAGQEVRNLSAAVRGRVGPGRPFPPGAMMSGGSREAGSPTQPASLSSSAFPMCFREQCIPCHPSCTGNAMRLVLCTRAGNPAAVPCRVLLPVHVGCRTVPASHLLPGDLARPLHRCEGWREENAACLGRSLHQPCPCLCRQGCCCGSLDGTSGPGKTHVRGRQAGEPQRKPLEKRQPCQLLAWPSPTPSSAGAV